MKKFLKYTAFTLLILVLVGITSIAILVHNVLKPSTIKPAISEFAKENLGRDIQINGDLSLSFYPVIGVTVHDLVIGNPATFKQKEFARIKNATIGVKLLPLLNKKIESNGIILSGIDINLIKKASGEVNWNFVPKNSSITIKTTDKAKTHRNTASFNAAELALGLSISGVNIEQTNLTYRDEKINKAYKVTNFNLQVKKINLRAPFGLTAGMTFTDPAAPFTTQLTLTANVVAHLEQKRYELRDIKFTSQIQQADKKMTAIARGNMLVDLNRETLTWQNFNGTLENINWNGKIVITQLTHSPLVNGEMLVSPFDLRTFLQKIGVDTSALQQANPAQGKINFTADTTGLVANSQWQIANIQANKIRLDHINISTKFHDEKLAVTQFSANLYGGTAVGHGEINLANPIPTMSWQVKMSRVQAGDLLNDLAEKKSSLKLTGIANANLQITTAGKEKPALLSHLNGSGDFTLTNGILKGIDVAYLLEEAYAKLQKQNNANKNNKQTDFGNLTATVQIKNGVITNNDLVMTSPRFVTRGSGTIDLVNNRIQYGLKTTVQNLSKDQKNDLRNLYGLPLPILVRGSLDDPSISLDLSALLAALAQQEVDRMKEKALDKVRDKVEQAVPDAGKLLKGLFR